MINAVADANPNATPLDPAEVLGSLPEPVFIVDAADRVRFGNPAAEQFLGAASGRLDEQTISRIRGTDCPLVALIGRARNLGRGVHQHAVQRFAGLVGPPPIGATATPFPGREGWILISVREHSMVREMDRRLASRDAGQGAATMAAVLAHEVRNPLSGIRGAAQLIEQRADREESDLARLIRDECDRVCALIDRMELFAPHPPLPRAAVNVHEALDHVRTLAEASFAKNTSIEIDYDPSLPLVLGSRDELVQVFLNLIKNACEAVSADGGRIRISTAFRNGIRLAMPGANGLRSVPIEIAIDDNGPGITESVRHSLFDAFVTTKTRGSGLGLALVAKLVEDHDGLIEFESDSDGTVFRLRLPVADDLRGAVRP